MVTAHPHLWCSVFVRTAASDMVLEQCTAPISMTFRQDVNMDERGAVEFPPRSPDLSLWGTLKDVADRRKPATLAALEEI